MYICIVYTKICVNNLRSVSFPIKLNPKIQPLIKEEILLISSLISSNTLIELIDIRSKQKRYNYFF